jgi:hypothetical protein
VPQPAYLQFGYFLPYASVVRTSDENDLPLSSTSIPGPSAPPRRLSVLRERACEDVSSPPAPCSDDNPPPFDPGH